MKSSDRGGDDHSEIILLGRHNRRQRQEKGHSVRKLQATSAAEG